MNVMFGVRPNVPVKKIAATNSVITVKGKPYFVKSEVQIEDSKPKHGNYIHLDVLPLTSQGLQRMEFFQRGGKAYGIEKVQSIDTFGA